MVSIPQVLAAFTFLALMASCVPPDPPLINTLVATRSIPETAAVNIHRYIAKHRGWSRGAYYLLRYPDDDGYAVFEIVHRADESRPPSVGPGKSFSLYCDPRSYRVVKEMRSQ